jgi:hypothetical protein
VVTWINKLWRPCLGYKSAIEVYNLHYQTNFEGSKLLS